ncbi:MAG: MFS transporter [Bacteroidales bacterium]|jgi:MFS family permease|nr:MFS transporter [Bacteroidales bacterium]
MTEIIKKSLRDSATARWIALLFISATMFFAYMFVDILAPLAKVLEINFSWSPDTFGTVGGSEFILNILGFLIIAGIILDKIGVRNSAVVAGGLMLIGSAIKFYGVSAAFNNGGFGYEFLNSFWTSFPASAKMACIGFAIFGCGVEMAGITVSKAIVKWFKGKELALAMGLEMSIARLGVFTVFMMSPKWAESGGVSLAVGIGALLLCIGFLTFCSYYIMDLRLDRQEKIAESPEDEFKFSDLKQIFTSKTFLITAGLCVLFYASIFPFQKFAVGMLDSRLDNSPMLPNELFALFPIGAMILTPLLGFFLDYKGKGATMLICGSLLMMICHTIFALTPDTVFTFPVALTAIILLGISFSLVPASLWPSVPKLVEHKVLGSAYAVIFWIQNIGLMLVPILIGYALKASNAGVNIAEGGKYNYTVPMLIFASFGVLAFLLGLWLKAEDKKKGYGLELPNKKK